jgi:hypothetical protein
MVQGVIVTQPGYEIELFTTVTSGGDLRNGLIQIDEGPDGTLFIGQDFYDGHSQIYAVNPDGTYSMFGSPSVLDPDAVTVNSTGFVFTGGDGYIYQITPSGSSSLLTRRDFYPAGPSHLEVSPSDELYALWSSSGIKNIYSVDSFGGITLLGLADSITFDEMGNEYVLRYDEIFVKYANGTEAILLTGVLGSNIEYHPSGFFLTVGDGVVYLTPMDRSGTVILASGFTFATDVTVASSGDIFVTDLFDVYRIYLIDENEPPVADAGPDQTVNEGDILFLDGSESKSGTGSPSMEGLVSYWKFDEGVGGIAYDSRDGNDGNVNGPVWITGQVNDALQFDGINDYVNCGDDNSLKISGSLTVETLVKYNGYTGASGTGIFPNIVSNADYALSSHKQDWKGFFLSSVRNYPSPSRDGMIRFSVLNPYEVEQIQSPERYDDGKWHHIVGVFEPNSHISLYVDGEIVANRSTTFSSFTPSTLPLSIGRGSENDVYHYFAGSIDEVAIYQRALNQNEIRCHYNNSLLGKGYFEGSCGSSQIISYEWDFDSDGIYDYQETSTYAPDGIFDGITEHIYGDNGNFTAILRVTDSQNLTATDTCNITVLNVDPIASLETPKMDVEISLRVAGSRWSNVGMTLFEDETQIGYIEVERWSGSPDDNPSYVNPSLPTSLDLTKSYRAVVTYDPYPDSGDEIRGDQPNNGKDKQNNAGNPVWVILKFPNGSEERAHHTFNTQQSKKRNSNHWNHEEPWEVDIMELLEGHSFEVSTHVTDPGSDDLTFIYSYGSQVISKTYLNDPPDPDPYPSPQVNPRDIIDTTQIIYEGGGTLDLAVEDDDGGTMSLSLDLA